MGDDILLVLQDPELEEWLASRLEAWGHRLLRADNPGPALDTLAQHHPPLTIIDNPVTGFESLHLLRDIRRDFPWSEVIMLVPPSDLERGARSLELGASDYLVKPLSGNRLGIALKRAQERLIVKTKLAVLSGEALGEAPARQVESVMRHLDTGTACATLLYDIQQRYRQLFDEVPCYISVLDSEFRITDVNRRFKEDFGDLVGYACFDVYQGRCEGCPECPVAETFVDGQAHQYEQVVTALSGEHYNVLTWTAPIRNAAGQITQVMEMSTNITQIRQLQDHLASLGMLIGSINHGVKGLLTALDGGMYSINTGLKNHDIDRVMKGWEVVELFVGRIKRTVLDVLYYAKDRGLDFEEVDVADFAHQVALTGEYAAKKHQLEFELSIADDVGTFYVDPNALNPALINLIENSVDACLDDYAKDHHRIVFSVHREDDVVVLDIEDNGMGMSEEVKENMFTLFFTSKGSSGTGLGLFIANDTVAQHGGTITVDSEPGQGSHFHVRIPERPRAVLPD